MKKTCNYIEIEQACNSPFVTTNEIMIILGGVSKSKADSFRQELEDKLDKEYIAAQSESNKDIKSKLEAACFYFNDTRPHRLPLDRVLKEAHIDLDMVRREANKMRRALKIERSN